MSNNISYVRIMIYKARVRFLRIGVSRFLSSKSLKSIGNGLFASQDLPAEMLITWFRGDIIPIERYGLNKALGRGGYGIQVHEKQILDCHDYCKSKECWASFANCPLNLIDTCPNGGMKKQNCTSANAKLVIHDGNRAYLKSTKPILRGEEVLWKYGKDYIMFD